MRVYKNKVIIKQTLILILCLGITALSFGSDSGNSDWPRWRGKNMDGKALDTGVFKFDQGYGLKVAWKKTLGSSYASISIADGRAVTTFSDSTSEFVVALDVESGAELWRYKLGETYEGHDGSHDGQISTPTIDGDTIYLYERTGRLLALDVKSGKERWSHDVKSEISPLEPFHGFGSSPIALGDVLMCQTGGTNGHTVCGFSKSDGKVLWSAGSDTVNYQSPVSAKFFGDDQFIAIADHYVSGINPKTGETLWQYRHNGRNGSINPLVVGDDMIFLNHGFRESSMLQLSKADGKYAVNELWKNRNIRQTFNSTVHHEGYLYSYSGNFITCVDANTGESVWKSRPPGDGFLILVDGHLVILTKRGTVHVAKASPEEYIEMASTQAFTGLTWTPPSFANGSIYARNLTEIARIDIAPVDAAELILDQPEFRFLNPNGDFAKFVKKAEAAPSGQKENIVDEFMKSHNVSPIIEAGKYAHIVFRGEAKDVAVIGDMLNVGQEQAMRSIEGTDFFFASFELEPDTQIPYQIRRDFDNVITDALNPNGTAPGGPATLRGEASILRMPKVKISDHFLSRENVAKGTIETFSMDSKILGNSRNVHVYLPAGYADSNARYPVLFVNYGRGAKDSQAIPVSLDNLIADKKIKPIIAVFVEAPNSFREYARNQKDQHAQMYAEELAAMIDAKYRILAKPEARAIMGGDEGGFAALYTAFKNPGVFGNAASQSGHLMLNAGGAELRALITSQKGVSIKLYQDWGLYDLNYNANTRWTDLNRDFNKFLRDEGYEVAGGELSEGFGWASWRNRTDNILITFFPAK